MCTLRCRNPPFCRYRFYDFCTPYPLLFSLPTAHITAFCRCYSLSSLDSISDPESTRGTYEYQGWVSGLAFGSFSKVSEGISQKVTTQNKVPREID